MAGSEFNDYYSITVKPILDTTDMAGKIQNSISSAIKKAWDTDIDFTKINRKSYGKLHEEAEDRLTRARELFEGMQNERTKGLANGTWTAANESAYKNASKQYGDARDALANLDSNVTKAAATYNTMTSAVTAVIDLFKKMYEEGTRILDMAKRYSNEYFTSESIFMGQQGKATRDTMLKYGLDTNTAMGFNTAMSSLGISESDFGLLTENQRNALIELTETYKEGMESIDPDKLKAYNEQVQEFQLLQAKFSIELRTTVMKLLAESDSLPRLIENAGEILEHIIDILDSPTAHFVFDTFINFLDSFFAVLEKITGVFSGLFGGGGNTTNNNTTNIYANSSTSISDITTAIAMGSNYN